MQQTKTEGNCWVLVGWSEKTVQISLSEEGKAYESYVVLLGFAARRGVNNRSEVGQA